MQLDYKDIIIKHYALSMSGSEIARQTGFSKSGVNDFLRAFKKCEDLSYPLPAGITNYGIALKVYGSVPGSGGRNENIELPDYEEAAKLMATRKNMTLMFLWNRYKKKCEEEGARFYQYSQYCELYNKWCEENYEIAQNIRILEIASAADIIFLILIIVQRTMFSIRITRTNKQLEKTAYLDLHTGLPNKSYCEKFFHNDQFISEPTAVIVYDLNNLKRVNDTFGHMVVDQFILNFSNLLRNTIPAQDFVGRYGGDEFMAVIYNASNEKIHRINVKLDEEVKRFNKLNHSGDHLDINYAHGCAFSEDYSQCTFITLFNRADKNMYKDKMRSKNMEKSIDK